MTRAFEGRAVNGGHRLVLRNARDGHPLVKCLGCQLRPAKESTVRRSRHRRQEGRDPLSLPNWEGGMRERSAHARVHRRGRVNFEQVNSAALAVLPSLLARWLPSGRIQGHEYVALNPKRADRRLGSFSINLRTGRWADFATGDKGGDPISLAAYLADISQVEAARRLATMLGLEVDDVA